MNTYRYEQLSQHLYRIIDVTEVCCYLVVGKERACLLDTCNGIGNIKEIVSQITNLPVFVILSHGHLDHIGGAGLFDEVYLHKDDVPVFKKHGDMKYRIQDTLEHVQLPLKASDFIETYTGELREINDGDMFDLGDIHIKMILVKGHTPGMMCPLIVEERVIIFGDACGVGVLLFDEYSSCVTEYRESLHSLKHVESEYDRIYRNHGTFTSPKELLDNVIECCDLILAGEDDHEPTEFHGYEMFAAKRRDGHNRVDGKEGNLLYTIEKAK